LVTDSDPPQPPTVEQDDAGCEPVPADLVELHEVLEWEAAVRTRAAEASE
jgi:hypothetical protein